MAAAVQDHITPPHLPSSSSSRANPGRRNSSPQAAAVKARAQLTQPAAVALMCLPAHSAALLQLAMIVAQKMMQHLQAAARLLLAVVLLVSLGFGCQSWAGPAVHPKGRLRA